MKKVLLVTIFSILSLGAFAGVSDIGSASTTANSKKIELIAECQKQVNLKSLDGYELLDKCVSDGRTPEVVKACASGAKLLVNWDKVPFFIECLDSDADSSRIEGCVNLARKESPSNIPAFMDICLDN